MAKLTHLDEQGRARMVDVSDKDVTRRAATARGRVHMTPETLALILGGALKKGDALGTARLAGIMAAKRTAALIPLCHPLPLSSVQVEITPAPDQAGLVIEATVKVTGRTGVEMEALTAVSVAALTIYDMAKAVDRGMTISDIRLVHKEGGKSGTYTTANETTDTEATPVETPSPDQGKASARRRFAALSAFLTRWRLKSAEHLAQAAGVRANALFRE